ncbi:MAG: lysostaphin resistance A-like protein [Polyangiaceae bacterium]
MPRRRIVAILVGTVAACLAYIVLWNRVADRVYALPPIEKWAISVPAHLVTIALAYGGAVLLWRKSAARELGLVPPVLSPIAVAVAAFVPAVAVLATAPGAKMNLPAQDILLSAALPGFFEELLFRGLVLGALQRDLRMAFWPAAILSSLAFGAAHLLNFGDAQDWGQLALATAGGLFFAWLRVRWRTLWMPIATHALMDAAWLIVPQSSAVGNGRLQLARVLEVAVTIALTARLTKKIERATSG